MGYIRVDWPWSQEWLDAVEYDEETGEPMDDEVVPGDNCSVFVDEEIYEQGVAAFYELQMERYETDER